MAQVHETVRDGATMKMQEVKAGVDAPANGAPELSPAATM
jgi:copper(I)-binding protein